jgi:hypothetical protein
MELVVADGSRLPLCLTASLPDLLQAVTLMRGELSEASSYTLIMGGGLPADQEGTSAARRRIRTPVHAVGPASSSP